MCLNLKIKPFSFSLLQPLKTSQGIIKSKQGWLILIETKAGNCGWGEVAPIDYEERKRCARLLQSIGPSTSRASLEKSLSQWPGSLAFGIGAALGELDGLLDCGGEKDFQNTTNSAILLPENNSIINRIDYLLLNNTCESKSLTLKWKVAVENNLDEETLLRKILEILPGNSKLRIDANAGWDRKQARNWANHLLKDKRLEWLEQPLPVNDIEGLRELSKDVPIALDESLLANPYLRHQWHSWQIRRPLIDGDPRILLKELHQGMAYRAISTAFETGIGLRWVHHLAALQQKGPTPTAPGLAPGWCPDGPLFRNKPQLVWEAA